MVKADLLIYDSAEPPLGAMAHQLYAKLAASPRRLALAGPAGSGKTTICELIAGTSTLLDDDISYVSHPPVPIFNHADGIKEEVLEWIARARTRALIPSEQATFEDFCDFLGLSVGVVRHDMWDLMGPLWVAMHKLLEDAYDHLPARELADINELQPGEKVDAKVAFVDKYKSLFRTSLQLYGQAIKDMCTNEYYWVEKTVERGIGNPLCLNGDTRFTAEMNLLRNTGWTSVYLSIERDTQALRRPDLTEEQLAHISENGMNPNDCDIIIDANQPLTGVLSDLVRFLSFTRVPVTTR